MTKAIFSLPLLLSVVMFTSAESSDSPPLPECNLTYAFPRTYSKFKMNNIALDDKAIMITIPDTNFGECTLNVSKVNEELAVPDSVHMFVVILLHCQHDHAIHIFNEGPHNDNAIALLQIAECIINIKDVIELGKSFDTKVLNLMHTTQSLYEVAEFTSSHCELLQNIGTYAYISVELQENYSFKDVFWCSDSFPMMAEVIFKNTSWNSLPDRFVQKFPNLQSLEIPHNNFSLPPSEFPWTDDTLILPRNLSRTSFMDDHYSKAFSLSIPSNIYRRIYDLDYNNIEDLSNFSFHGILHKISLKGNGLHRIGNDTFKDVVGLQALDLSLNNLKELPVELFRNLNHVTSIDLSGNAIKHIAKDTFAHLISITVINLSNNNLTSIDAGAFTNLQNLTELHLEFNNLGFLLPDSFPLDSLMLKKIILHHNPLHTIPEFIFWLRKIEHVDLSDASITLENITSYVENMDRNRVLNGIVDSASSTDLDDLLTRAETLRKIDLSHNQVKRIFIEDGATAKTRKMMKILLLHYEFDLSENPLTCDCSILPISRLIKHMLTENKIDKNEYYFSNWICDKPPELHGVKLLKVKPEQTYCPIEIENCPTECSCFRRSKLATIIVDCRALGLRHMHSNLPRGSDLELWYSENNLTRTDPMSCLSNVVSLDVSNNRIEDFPAETLDIMIKLQRLFLHDNLLTYLPEKITQLNLRQVELHPNPLHCDCNSRWLKHWLNRKKVTGYDKVTCNLKDNEDGKLVIEVPDKSFTCPEVFDPLLNVVLPSVVICVVLAIIIIILFILYAYRLEVKVLLFVYFGIHPFDKDSPTGSENIDCVVVHSGSNTDWVMQSIVDMLESENYRYLVCDMARDFIVGFSFQENINKIIRRSKRIIFCLSTDWNASIESFNIAWSIAQDKIKESKSHFAILITHGVCKKDIRDEELRLYIKHGRYIDSQDRLFCKKILYYMPTCSDCRRNDHDTYEGIEKGRKSKEISKCFVNRCFDEDLTDVVTKTRDAQPRTLYDPSHAFITYAEDDINYVLEVLQPCLEEKGFTLIIPDRDFVVGASKEENILHAVNSSQRTIFVLSRKHCRDEWSLFTFRAAFEKVLRDKVNHLLIIILEDVATEQLDSEISHYLNNYICLHANDRWFEKKLLNGMPYLKNCEQLHTSPMFITEGRHAGAAVDVDHVAVNVDDGYDPPVKCPDVGVNVLDKERHSDDEAINEPISTRL